MKFLLHLGRITALLQLTRELLDPFDYTAFDLYIAPRQQFVCRHIEERLKAKRSFKVGFARPPLVPGHLLAALAAQQESQLGLG